MEGRGWDVVWQVGRDKWGVIPRRSCGGVARRVTHDSAANSTNTHNSGHA